MKPTRTVFLSFTLNTAAVADYFRALADELVKLGYQVVIITDGRRAQKVSEDTNPAIYTWPSKRPTRLADARFLSRLIRRYRPVMTFSNFGAGNLNLLVSWLMKVPLRFVTYLTMADPILLRKRTLVDQLQFVRKRIIYRLPTMIFPNAHAMKLELMKIYRVPCERIKTFHIGLAARTELIQKELKTSPDLVCAGALTQGKGHDVLIRALESVYKENPNVHLTIYGEGPERSALESLLHSLGLGDVVKLPGQASHEEVMQGIAASYALIHPSRYDAFPVAVIEALSVGTPIIASMVGGIPEIFREGIDGFTVPVGDSVVLAERITRLCSDTQLRHEMSQNCQAHFIENFELTDAVHKQASWFDTMVKSEMIR